MPAAHITGSSAGTISTTHTHSLTYVLVCVTRTETAQHTRAGTLSSHVLWSQFTRSKTHKAPNRAMLLVTGMFARIIALSSDLTHAHDQKRLRLIL